MEIEEPKENVLSLTSSLIHEIDNPRFLSFSNADASGNATSTSTQVFYVSSATLQYMDLERPDVKNAICFFPSPVYSLSTLPDQSSSLLLATHAKSISFIDSHNRVLMGMIAFEKPFQNCCWSLKNNQLYGLYSFIHS